MRADVLGLLVSSLAVVSATPYTPRDTNQKGNGNGDGDAGAGVRRVQTGFRPPYLTNLMDPSPLKERLESCANSPNVATDFTISHRGAPLQFPEHTRQGWEAAAQQGAGVIECDVAFTSDLELVCRHSDCDLHTTTNILAVPELAAKCSTPFTPASEDGSEPASAKCCTQDITLAEFKSLCGKMDAFNSTATTPEESLTGGTEPWRTDLYDTTCGTLMTHAEFIDFVDHDLGQEGPLQFTSELKTPSVDMPFEGGNYTQEVYAQQLVDEYKAAGIDPRRVWLQSFLPDDIFYWIDSEPDFGRQAVYLDERVDTPEGYEEAVRIVPDLVDRGVRIISLPIFALLALDDDDNRIVPSTYVNAARDAGVDLMAWTLERSGPLTEVAADEEYYYQTMLPVIKDDGDMYEVVHVLAQDVGVLGIFSDWPATVTYYANCFGL